MNNGKDLVICCVIPAIVLSVLILGLMHFMLDAIEMHTYNTMTQTKLEIIKNDYFKKI